MKNIFAELGHLVVVGFDDVEGFLKNDQPQIQKDIAEATTAVGAVAAIAAEVEDPETASKVATLTTEVSNGLSDLGSAVAAADASTNVAQLVAAGTGLANSLASGDVGIKSSTTQAAVLAATGKITGVVSTLSALAPAATPVS